MSAPTGSRVEKRTLQLKNETTDAHKRRKHKEDAKKKQAAEVRELWFNTHATRTESQTDVEDCECQGCQILRNEQTQQEFKLTQISAKINATKCREKQHDEEVAKEDCTCHKTSADLRRERQRECDYEWHTSLPHEHIAVRAYLKSTQSHPPTANRRSQRRDEARRYKELSSIYTTKPCNGRQLQHSSCKTIAWWEPQVCTNTRANESAYRQQDPSPSRSSAKLSRQQTPKRQEKVGCWEFFKIFKSDKQQQETEAYVRAQNSNQCTNKSSNRPQEYSESSLTPEEIELLEILRTTYARELRPEQDSRAAQHTSKADTACCALKKKTDQQTAEEAYYPIPVDTQKHVVCSCGKDAEAAAPEEQAPKDEASKEKTTRRRDKRRKSKAEEPQQQGSNAEENKFRYPTKTTSDEIHAPKKVKSVQAELNAEHKTEVEKSKPDSTLYAPEGVKAKNNKSAKPKELPAEAEAEENQTSCCSIFGRKKAKPSTEKEKSKKPQSTKRKKYTENKQKSKAQASQPIGRERIKGTNLNKRNQPAFRPKAATKPKLSLMDPTSTKAPAPQKPPPAATKVQQPSKKPESQPGGDGKVVRRRNLPAFRPKTIPKSKPSSRKIQAEPQPAGKSSLKKKRSSETTGCLCLKPKKQGKRSTFDESSRRKNRDEKHTTPKMSKKTPDLVRSQEKIEKHSSKKSDETKRKSDKDKAFKQMEEQTSGTLLCCSCQSKSKKNKQKELEEPKTLPSKSGKVEKDKREKSAETKQKLPMPRPREQIQRDKPRKREDIKQEKAPRVMPKKSAGSKPTPQTAKGQKRIEKQTSGISVWTCCRSGKHGKGEKLDEPKKKDSKAKSKDLAQKGAAKKVESSQQKAKPKNQEEVTKQSSKMPGWSCCSSGDKEKEKSKKTAIKIKSHDKVQRDPPKKLDESKQKASKTTKDQQKAEEKPSKTSCWSCCSSGGKEKIKQQDEPKRSSPRSISPDKARKDRPKKLEDSKQKASKTTKDQEKVEEKPSKTSCWSCCSSGGKEKKKQQDESKRSSPKSISPDKARKNRPNKLEDSKQKAPKTTKDQEKVEEKPSKTSCWSCCSSGGKEKKKQQDEPKRSSPRSISPDKARKDRPKKLEDSKQKAPKTTKDQEKVEEKPSKTSCWSCCSSGGKKKIKLQDESKRSSPRSISPDKARKDRPKKLEDSKQKASKTTKDEEKAEEKPSKTSCWSCCSNGDKKKTKKIEESTKSREQVQKQSSKTSCWSCCSCRDTDKTKKIDEPSKKHLDAKSQEATAKDWSRKSEKTSTQSQSPSKAPMDRYRKLERPDNPKKRDDSKQKSSRTKNQEGVQKQSSKTSCWSCCSSGDKRRKEKLDEPKMTASQGMKQRQAQANKPKDLDDAKRKPSKTNEKKKAQKQTSKTSCTCCVVNGDEDVESNKSKGSKSNVKKGPTDSRQRTDAQNKPNDAKQKSAKTTPKDEQKKPSKKYSLFWKRSKKHKSKVEPTEQRTAPTRTESRGQLSGAEQADQTKFKMAKSTTSKTQQDKGKRKSSKTSIYSCCSGKEPKANAGSREELQPAEACAYETKPEDISYCKALYQELENIITQQNQCPLQITQPHMKKHNKKPENKNFNCKKKPKQDEQSEKRSTEVKKERKESKENKSSRNETHNVAKTTPTEHTEHKKKPPAESESSANDAIPEVDYVPDYVLGKPFQVRNRTLRYSLFTNSRGRKRLHNPEGHEVDSQA
ncbi:titin homolog [Ceratitis capitata]|uniref:titin homolog n=1 Tax=Ceratitis capitata TaxID=7213 RepID=UPI000C6C7096|nr:titin homolog [Ceratitis capitata]